MNLAAPTEKTTAAPVSRNGFSRSENGCFDETDHCVTRSLCNQEWLNPVLLDSLRGMAQAAI
jgi:hypothetical protein